MSATTSMQPAMMPDPPTSPPTSFPAWGDRRDVFRGVDWHTYSQLLPVARRRTTHPPDL